MFTIPGTGREVAKRRSNKNGNDYPCVICGIPCPSPRYSVHLHGGGSVLVTQEEAKTMDPAGDMYCYPIGPSCLKKYPELKNGYVFDSEKGGMIMGKTIIPAGPPFTI